MKRFVIVIVAVIATSALWTAGWMYVASRISAEALFLAEGDGTVQPRLECETFSVGGFPFSFSPHCVNAEIVSADMTISVPDIRATALFYRPTHFQVFATGPARITDAFTGAMTGLDWSNLHASIRLDDNRLARASLVADEIVYTDLLFGEEVLATAHRGEVHLLDTSLENNQASTQDIDFYLMVEGADSAPLEIANGTLSVDGQIAGLPDPGFWGDPQVLGFWQAREGHITLRTLDGRAEGVMVEANGEARLNDRGLVDGELEVASQGLASRLGQLADPSLVEIFVGTPGDDGTARQRVRVNDGTVVVGILPIMAIPPLF